MIWYVKHMRKAYQQGADKAEKAYLHKQRLQNSSSRRQGQRKQQEGVEEEEEEEGQEEEQPPHNARVDSRSRRVGGRVLRPRKAGVQSMQVDDAGVEGTTEKGEEEEEGSDSGDTSSFSRRGLGAGNSSPSRASTEVLQQSTGTEELEEGMVEEEGELGRGSSDEDHLSNPSCNSGNSGQDTGGEGAPKPSRQTLLQQARESGGVEARRLAVMERRMSQHRFYVSVQILEVRVPACCATAIVSGCDMLECLLSMWPWLICFKALDTALLF
jgi:hypothetical protein